MAGILDDPRISRGMAAQLALRRDRIAAGERPIGWKAGFGAPAALRKFDLDGPLVGFMTDRSQIATGAEVSLSGWIKPVAEPEIAIHIGRDLHAGADDSTVRASIAALAPAIELADLNEPPEDVEAILSGNIFHRYVVLGAQDSSRADADTGHLMAVVSRNGTQTARTADLEANTGTLIEVVRRTADMLDAFGEELRAGDVVIAGSIVPPLFLERDDREISYTLEPIGAVSVRFSWT